MNNTTEAPLMTNDMTAAVDVEGLIYLGCELVIGVLSVLGNGLVLLVITRESQLQTFTNYFIASLAMADLLVGLLGIPCAIVSKYGLPADFYGCLLTNTVIVILTQISIFGLLAVAVERFIAIKFPFIYHTHCTGPVAAAVIAFTWLSAILVGLVPMFGWHQPVMSLTKCAFVSVIDMNYMVYFNFFGCVLLPLLVMFLLYCFIFQVVFRQLKQINSLQVAMETVTTTRRQIFMKELRAVKWFCAVIVFFAVCWLPLHVLNTMLLVTGSTCFSCFNPAIILSHANSALNPIFYAFVNKKFKCAFKRLVFCSKEPLVDTTMASSQPG
ncbi:hypothetical protein NP493_356g02063 [Ridgeia piscesae]|uniref:G-protein coupled receptors family 1 profile domain-containing protein n=1 Tax=Ridgeia piscesae TaxID=27915 RepID=A0AAD9L3Z2_RIDPI|nr:hypothetical protein NP493_356g02063 [Ridgeia piscesae]